MQKDVLVLGVGNLLLEDEGVGVHAVRRLQDMDLPPHVEVLDGGTVGFELLPALRGRRKVIIVDALRADAEPGNVILLGARDVEAESPPPLFVHQGGLGELLAFARQIRPSPEIVLFGIVPASIRSWKPELSPALESRMPFILSRLLEEAVIRRRKDVLPPPDMTGG
jgi:hydrogenase maturation protease